MKKSLVIILVGFACLMVLAAGCTNTSDTTPATPVADATSWSGTWSTTWTSANHATLVPTESVMLTQTGSTVTGTYLDDMGNLTGSITGTVQGTKLTGTWTETDVSATGSFEFEQSADENAFTGTWTADHDYVDAVTNVTYLWNGVRK